MATVNCRTYKGMTQMTSKGISALDFREDRGLSASRRTVIKTLIPLLALLLMAFACTKTESPEIMASAPTPTPEPTAPAPSPATEPTPTLTVIEPALSSDAPDYCNAPAADKLQRIRRTPSGPYFVHHPVTANPESQTVVFLPGGNGTERSAERIWDRYLSEGTGMEQFRLVIPYSPEEIGFMGEARLVVAIVDEVLACYGGDAARVHIAGMSNGGHAAFETMLAYPERFVTLLGAPGSFPTEDPAKWASSLGDRAVFNGVGSEDDEWIPEVRATHAALLAEGVESVFMEFAGQRHSINSEFDESVFFDFWTSH